ncbi:MAG: DUF3179 domain-containing protein [Eubacteriales bacterium]
MNCYYYNYYLTEVNKDNNKLPETIRKIGRFNDLETDWDLHKVPYKELYKVRKKDEIMAIDLPVFAEVKEARRWIKAQEPIIVLKNGKAKGYPIQILIWHEVVNDVFSDKPIVITYSPLCNSANVFSRELDGKVISFGTSGIFRNSCTIMYDRDTESLWDTFTGEAIAGYYTGKKLEMLPSCMVPFNDFAESYPEGLVVLSTETGFIRRYGNNPYVGYDESDRPYFYTGNIDDRLPPFELVIGLSCNGKSRAYPYKILKEKRVINDDFCEPRVIFFQDGMTSPLDKPVISRGKDIGAAIVFSPILNGQKLNFYNENNQIYDMETNSEWNVLGNSINGKLKGEGLKMLIYWDSFWFAWSSYFPDTEIYKEN